MSRSLTRTLPGVPAPPPSKARGLLPTLPNGSPAHWQPGGRCRTRCCPGYTSPQCPGAAFTIRGGVSSLTRGWGYPSPWGQRAKKTKHFLKILTTGKDPKGLEGNSLLPTERTQPPLARRQAKAARMPSSSPPPPSSRTVREEDVATSSAGNLSSSRTCGRTAGGYATVDLRKNYAKMRVCFAFARRETHLPIIAPDTRVFGHSEGDNFGRPRTVDKFPHTPPPHHNFPPPLNPPPPKQGKLPGGRGGAE